MLCAWNAVSTSRMLSHVSQPMRRCVVPITSFIRFSNVPHRAMTLAFSKLWYSFTRRSAKYAHGPSAAGKRFSRALLRVEMRGRRRERRCSARSVGCIALSVALRGVAAAAAAAASAGDASPALLPIPPLLVAVRGYMPARSARSDCVVRQMLVDRQYSCSAASSTVLGRSEPTYRLRSSFPTATNWSAPRLVSMAYGVCSRSHPVHSSAWYSSRVRFSAASTADRGCAVAAVAAVAADAIRRKVASAGSAFFQNAVSVAFSADVLLARKDRVICARSPCRVTTTTLRSSRSSGTGTYGRDDAVYAISSAADVVVAAVDAAAAADVAGATVAVDNAASIGKGCCRYEDVVVEK